MKNIPLQILFEIAKLKRKGILIALWRSRRICLSVFTSKLKRKKRLKRDGLVVPAGLGFSTTMKCNLKCKGCYSRFHPRENEMSLETIDKFLSDATKAGVFFFVMTGGEPFLRPETVEIYKKYRGALFMVITNGTLIDERLTSEIAKAGNIFPVISVEGNEDLTDERRGAGVYKKIQCAMDLFSKEKVFFGFSSTVTNGNVQELVSETFINNMIESGCVLGIFNDLVPFDENDRKLMPSKKEYETFNKKLEKLKREKPILFLHLPEDEYDENKMCIAVLNGGMHINSQGYVEPCPFAHYARENIVHDSFEDVLRSPFLLAIREHPSALKLGSYGCALASNGGILKEIAEATGAKRTDKFNC